jgi:4-alpha-glucanotransferase
LSPSAEQEITLLRRLARLHGVQTAYEGIEHRRIVAEPESLLTVLRGLGAPIESASGAAGAIQARLEALWRWRLEPVAVVWEGNGGFARLRLPETAASGRASCTLRLEAGEERSWEVELASLPERGADTIDGERCVEKQIGLPGELPAGYHQLVIETGGRRLEALVIVAPVKTYGGATARRPTWGVFLPLYALRTGRSRAIADFTDLQRLIEWAAVQGAGLVGTLPLLPAFLDRPFDPSPYSPVSRLLWNELYVDLGAAAPALNGDAERVDYRAVMAAKRRALEQQMKGLDAEAERALEAFLAAEPRVVDYARFRAASERLGHNWRAWPTPQRGGELTPDDYDADTVRYYCYAQWRAHEQLAVTSARARELETDLYLDLPVGVHADGYDAWRYRDGFVEGVSVGAPPDIVTNSGQDWGFAPLDPEKQRFTGYAYMRRYLAHHFSGASILRLDHAMGFERLFWVPHGATPSEGVYVRYPTDELFAVLCVESQRKQAAVVGENLGIATTRVNAALARHGIGRMYVLSIEMTGRAEEPYRSIPRPVVAGFGTHDLPTLAAFWQDLDIDERVRLGVLEPERGEAERAGRQVNKAALVTHLQREGLLGDSPALEDVMKAITALLARSPASRLLVNLEDAWLEERPQNVPGTTTDEYPNWQRRARYALEELEALPLVAEVIELLRQARPTSARASTSPRVSM